MRASLADQGSVAAAAGACTVAVALGSNLPSSAGDPIDTLIAVRPRLQERLRRVLGHERAGYWSPLFRTDPVGGPPGQPPYINAVVVVESSAPPRPRQAGALLEQLHQLEDDFGRQRLEHWGPRSLDLDLLWWGDLTIEEPALQLPHPRWHQRAFVLAPLLAIERTMPFQLPTGYPPLAVLLDATQERPPCPLQAQSRGWID
ncbi:MAG: 2-amino-4-hydroxy-6-hydroxymethyldihydropteridine diphosphokinase [Vulcanococcus sp.]